MKSVNCGNGCDGMEGEKKFLLAHSRPRQNPLDVMSFSKSGLLPGFRISLPLLHWRVCDANGGRPSSHSVSSQAPIHSWVDIVYMQAKYLA